MAYLYLAEACHYHAANDPERMLAERIEGLVSQEHAKWTAVREENAEHKDGRAGPVEHDRPAAS